MISERLLISLKQVTYYAVLLTCLIVKVTSAQEKQSSFKDVEKIFVKRCGVCHVENGVAPFPILEYSDVISHAKTIKRVIDTGYMPPWYVNEDSVKYLNSLRLDESEVALINQWYLDGCVLGESVESKEISPKSIADSEPDNGKYVEYGAFKSFEVPASDKDRYLRVSLVSDVDSIDKLEFIGVDVVPGNTNVVHHAEVYAIDRRSIDSLVFLETDYFFLDDMDAMPGTNYRFISSWLPGQDLDYFPRGTVKTIYENEVPVLLIHYAAYPIPQNDSTTVRFYLRDANVDPEVVECMEYSIVDPFAWNPNQIFIPKDSIVEKVISRVLDSQDTISIFALRPHAHQICVSMKAELVTPSGDSVLLLDLPKWDFDWQHFYRFKDFVVAPPGSKVVFYAKYDNTVRNPENPNYPPEDVYSSFRADDEMMVLFVLGRKYQQGDELSEIAYPKMNHVRH